MVAASAFSLILAFGATSLAGNPVVICIGMNLLASGLTAYLLRAVFGVSGTFSDPGIVGLAKINLPALQAVQAYPTHPVHQRTKPNRPTVTTKREADRSRH